MARKIEVEIVGDASSYQRALRGAQGQTSKFGKIAKAALVGGAAAGMYALGKAAKIGWDEFNQGQRGAAQTAAAIKSTGGVANVTARNVDELAQAMLRKTGIDDDAVVASENMLLTFTKVRNEVGRGNDIFNQTTQAVADMATRMNNGAIPSMEQMSNTTITVGKALNNPIAGLGRLTRVGVEFTERQKEQITALAESGRTMDAQKLILRELTKEFGGSAKAAGETFGGQLTKLRERLNNFLGILVGKAIPYLQRFIKWVGPLMSQALATARKAWNDLGAVLDRHRETVNRVRTAIGFLVKVLGVLVKAEILLYGTIFKVWIKILDVTLTVTGKVIAGVQKMIGFFRSLGGAARAVGGAVAAGFRIMLSPILTVINAVRTLIGAINSIPHPSLPDVGGIIGKIPGFASGGVVPGPRGAPRLIMAHAGETVLPTHRGGGSGGSVQVIVLGGDRGAIDWLRSLDARQGRRSGRGVL